MLTTGGGVQVRRIAFVPAVRKDAHTISAADVPNLIHLNPGTEFHLNGYADSSMRPFKGLEARKPAAGPAELATRWTTVLKAGAGLQNLGNTCFMNSVLQCLIHTPPLAELLLSPACPRPLPGRAGPDLLAATRELMQRSLQHRSGVLAPAAHAKSLRRVNGSFRLGRQEDAHEYLIALLDAMHEACVPRRAPGAPPPPGPPASFVTRIFGGVMASAVRCTSCGYESCTRDPFLDVNLEVAGAGSVTGALERFTAGEALDGANRYRCPREGRPVRAVKSLRIASPPAVLALQLKRFGFGGHGHKVTKRVDFGPVLDLGPFLGGGAGAGGGRGGARGPLPYDLYAVLVHQGHSVHSGHYFCFVKAPSGVWHCCDDASVGAVSERVVLAQRAYLLFYLRRGAAGGVEGAKGAEVVPNGAAGHEAQGAGKEPPPLAGPPGAGPGPSPRPAGLVQPGAENCRAGLAADAKPRPPSQAAAAGPAAAPAQGAAATPSGSSDSAPISAFVPGAGRRAAAGRGADPFPSQTRSRLLARVASLGTPVPIGRRAKRAAEDARLLNTLHRRRRRAGQGTPLQGGSPAPPEAAQAPLGARTAAGPGPPDARAAAPGPTQVSASAAAAPSSRPATPTVSEAGARMAQLARPRQASAREVAEPGVRAFLAAQARPAPGGAWEGVDAEAARAHARLLRAAGHARRAPDAYDAEYDAGRVKKVRRRGEEGPGGPGREAFDSAGAARRRGKAPAVELRGKKKARAVAAARRAGEGGANGDARTGPERE
uniref:Ubiquitin carboxyl-terminal hydrolase n=2 Tax=Auxenochlorella protothecoides TaxID=3075 RepID=A0A1D2A1N1_AUXPR